jgi:hypothetical protein
MFKLFDSFPNQEHAASLRHWLHCFGWSQTKPPETRFLEGTWFSQIRYLLLPTSLDHISDSGNLHDLFSMATYPIRIVDKYNHQANELLQYILDMWTHSGKMLQTH